MKINAEKFHRFAQKTTPATFTSINLGCRVNAAETNQLSQTLLNHGFAPSSKNPKIILINTCAVTKKGEGESIRKVKFYSKKYPRSHILVTGCISPQKLKNIKNIYFFNNSEKQKILTKNCSYTPKIRDKFSSSHRYILKIQSGCQHFCSYCIVPYRRPSLWSLPISKAIDIVNQAVKNGYQEIIITGTNLNLYKPGLANLVKSLLAQTTMPLISFGSVPLNCLNNKFIKIVTSYQLPACRQARRVTSYLHIPLQSGSDKVLKSMNRPYTRKKILKVIKKCKLKIKNLSLGTDIIVGFPNESKTDFLQTLNLCRQIGFNKIHVFRYSPRPGTSAQKLFQTLPKIKNSEKIRRSQFISRTTLPSRQTPEH